MSCATTSKGPPFLVARLPGRLSATRSSTTGYRDRRRVRAYAVTDRLGDDDRGEVELRGRRGARSAVEPPPCHVFVLSDGLNVNGSDLSRGLASGVAEGVSITGPVRRRYRLRRDLGHRRRCRRPEALGRGRSLRRRPTRWLRIYGRLGAVRSATHHHPRRGQRAL